MHEGVTWLYSLSTDPPDGLLPGGAPPYLSETEALHTLNSVYGLFVEIAEQNGIYTLVTRPAAANLDGIRTRVAASYTGTNLKLLYNQAVTDREDMRDNPAGIDLKNREWVRRVASGRSTGERGDDDRGPVALRARSDGARAQRRGRVGAARIDPDR